MTDVSFNEDQQAAIDKAVAWYSTVSGRLQIIGFDEFCRKRRLSMDTQTAKVAYIGYMQDRSRAVPNKVFRLFGYAGVGKTSVAKEIARRINVPTEYLAPTGKATYVLRRKGCEAITVHRFAFVPLGENDEGELMFSPRADPLTMPRLIILDEGSMVSKRDAEQLLSFGIPIIVLADPGQLEPVRGAAGFTDEQPDVLLSKVERQQGESKILHAATIIRTGRGVPDREYEDIKVRSRMPRLSEYMAFTGEDSQILCVRNATRTRVNSDIRRALCAEGKINIMNRSPYPVAGEKLIATFNDYSCDVVNGSQWLVVADPCFDEALERYDFDFVDAAGRVVEVSCGTRMSIKLMALDGTGRTAVFPLNSDCFSEGNSQLAQARRKEGAKRPGGFDFGYAITVHKSQGSEWDRVLFVEESLPAANQAKLVYTALTRASSYLEWYR